MMPRWPARKPLCEQPLLYKDKLKPEASFDTSRADDLTIAIATHGYGVGNWHLYNGRKAEAVVIFGKVVAGKERSAFGCIAAEADLKRLVDDASLAWSQTTHIANSCCCTKANSSRRLYSTAIGIFNNGCKAEAVAIFEKVVAGKERNAFGYIAAEADLKRLR